MVPDQMNVSADYLRKFGTHTTGHKFYDDQLPQMRTLIMTNVIEILRYYEDGIEIQIPSREDMICIHKDIELYLAEWREHLKFDINLDVANNKDLLLSLEKLSKTIYEKAKGVEVIDNLFIAKKIGLVSPFQRAVESAKPINKPDYQGISSLVRTKTKPQGRFG
jgi:hypothetical protein